MATSKPYQYGVSPHPRNWQEAAEALRGMKTSAPKAERKGPSLYDRLGAIEQMLKNGASSK